MTRAPSTGPALAILLLSTRALGAFQAVVPEPISTDRPSESAAPGVVPRGAIQLEAGYKLSGSEEDDTRIDTQTAPDLLLRLGALETLEARLTASGWSFQSAASGAKRGFNDVSLGVKWAIARETSVPAPALSLIAEVSLPVGAPGLTEEFVNPKLLLLLQKSLPKGASVTTNVGTSIVRLAADGERREATVVDVPYTALVAGSLGSRWGWFAELYGAFALRARPDRHQFQAGVTALVTRAVQLDVRGGVGLVASVPTWVFGTGVGLRMPF